MLNTILKPFALLFFCLMLNACGGESDGTISFDNGSTAADIESAAVAKAKLAIDSLVAAEGFSFTTKETIEVIVDINADPLQRTFVSVYRDYQQLASGRYYPNSDSRILDGELQNGIFKQSFIGLNNQQQYLLQVWFNDGSDPLEQELSVNNNQLIWQ
ncbi:MAG: hypothetical protein ACI93H_000131 [Psychromonas sp.]|jgi:hypothetical protein